MSQTHLQALTNHDDGCIKSFPIVKLPEGYLRIVDESGEDYIYPSELFVSIKLPAAVLKRLHGTSRGRPSRVRRRTRVLRVPKAQQGQ